VYPLSPGFEPESRKNKKASPAKMLFTKFSFIVDNESAGVLGRAHE
jgi:hypothetical protein